MPDADRFLMIRKNSMWERGFPRATNQIRNVKAQRKVTNDGKHDVSPMVRYVCPGPWRRWSGLRMRRNWLASAAVAAAAISVPVTALSGTAQAATSSGQQATATKSAVTSSTITRKAVTWNMVAATLAKKLVGDPYVYGGTSTAGFDCSGLAQWVYRHTGHGK